MSRVISFRDIKRCVPYFRDMTEVEMLHPEHDAHMQDVLQAMGFDIHEGVEYVANNHRDMLGNVGVGFRAVGIIDPNNREFLNSRLADNYDRMAAAGRSGNVDLADELSKLMGCSSAMAAIEETGAGCVDPEDLTLKQQEDLWIDPEYEVITQQMNTLKWICEDIRGSAYDEDGSVKKLCSV